MNNNIKDLLSVIIDGTLYGNFLSLIYVIKHVLHPYSKVSIIKLSAWFYMNIILPSDLGHYY